MFLTLLRQAVNGLVSEEPPARPWTPSYSVTRQGSGSDVTADDKSVTEKVAETVLNAATNGNGNGRTISFPVSEVSKEAVEESQEETKKVSSK